MQQDCAEGACGGAGKGCYGKKKVNVYFFDVSFKLN